MKTLPVVLASTSPYRKALLDKLHIPFTTISPICDEKLVEGEPPKERALRLAIAKAKGCIVTDSSLIVGSDQVCSIQGEILRKPGNKEKAIVQLLKQSGKTVTFYTGLCVYNTSTHQMRAVVDEFHVRFRDLDREEIKRYVTLDTPYQCAGSFKCEGLGISLFQELSGSDPNSLIGLPLIQLCSLLREQGYSIP
ncbi:Maf family nucleotide pyrophosphatase [Vibrio sp.]|nr:Maf family nucleotide pyrophosphatase [Vibrio sp.]